MLHTEGGGVSTDVKQTLRESEAVADYYKGLLNPFQVIHVIEKRRNMPAVTESLARPAQEPI